MQEMSLFCCGGDFYVHARGRTRGLGLTPPRGRGQLWGEDVGYVQGRLDRLQLHVPPTVTPSVLSRAAQRQMSLFRGGLKQLLRIFKKLFRENMSLNGKHVSWIWNRVFIWK